MKTIIKAAALVLAPMTAIAPDVLTLAVLASAGVVG